MCRKDFLLVIFCFMLFSCNAVFSQNKPNSCNNLDFNHRNGVVYYYFWEENNDGSIIDSTLKHPFSMNRLILLYSLKKNKTTNYNSAQMAHIINRLGKERNSAKTRINFQKSWYSNKVASSNTVVVFRKQNGTWTSVLTKPVLYFQKNDSKLFYINSSDTLRYNTKNISIHTNSYFIVSNDASEKPASTAYQFSGHSLPQKTNIFCEPTASRFLIFSNGYRGPNTDNDPSRNEIYLLDRTNYWYNIDNRFIERLKPDTSFYIDGSFSVETSNYYSKIKFGWRYLRAQIFSRKNSVNFKSLKQKSNYNGFMHRYQEGEIAGETFINAISNIPNTTIKDTLDFVCHSMGYAYMMGFIERVKNNVVLGKLYIVAPENASVLGMDWSIFQEVWQYGSNLDQANPDKLRQQDGIAPQVAVKNIETQASKSIGRIFTPDNWPNKHFVHAHMIYGYDWIFDRIHPGEKGYIFR